MSHEFDIYAGQGPGYDGPLHPPYPAINPDAYAEGIDYQNALSVQHATDEAAALYQAPRPGARKCEQCGPRGRTFTELSLPAWYCPSCRRDIAAETARKKAAYLRLPAVDEALFRRFLRGETPHVADGETHQFYDWTGARVARALGEVLVEVEPDPPRFRGSLVRLEPHVYLMPTGEVVTDEAGSASFGILESTRTPQPWSTPLDHRWEWYVAARRTDRFNSRTWKQEPEERWFWFKEINALPGHVREARERLRAEKIGATRNRLDARARQRREARLVALARIRDVVILAVIVLAIVAAVHFLS